MLSEQEARDAYADETSPQATLLASMRSAASIVSGLSVSVDGDADDYEQYVSHIKSAEIIVGGYLWATGGYVKSDGDLDSRVSYGSLAEVKDVASSALGSYSYDSAGSKRRVVRIV